MSTLIFNEFKNLDASDKYDHMYQEILDIVEEISGLDPDLIEPTTPFMSLGLDSLMSVEIAKRLGEKLSLNLPRTLIWTYSYMDLLIEFLIEEITKKGASDV